MHILTHMYDKQVSAELKAAFLAQLQNCSVVHENKRKDLNVC
jgi:hypothetical protein